MTLSMMADCFYAECFLCSNLTKRREDGYVIQDKLEKEE
jgi:hypothetical protein